MTVTLHYDLIGTGWAECTLKIDGAAATITASYLSDALNELCRAVIEVLEGAPEAQASFDEEPGEYRWRLQRVHVNRVRVRILDFPELWGEKPDSAGRVILDAECGLDPFATALLRELERLQRSLGVEGYLERWVEHPFPTQQVERLRGLLGKQTR